MKKNVAPTKSKRSDCRPVLGSRLLSAVEVVIGDAGELVLNCEVGDDSVVGNCSIGVH